MDMSDQTQRRNIKKIKTAKLMIFIVEFELLGGKRVPFLRLGGRAFKNSRRIFCCIKELKF
jgi:hypothetical protein